VFQLRPLKFYIDNQLVADVDPDRKQFPRLRYAPFILGMGELFHKWGDLRIEGYIQGKQMISKFMSGKGVDTKFLLMPDDNELVADGADSTRVVLRVTDEFGCVRPFANDAIKFELEGPAEIIGDNPFSLVGGTGAIWIRAKE
jgi:beta-galactosidase